MHRLLLLFAVACSSSSKTTPPPAAPQLADVIAANTSNVTRLAPTIFFPLLYLRDLVEKPVPACWEALEKKFVAGYQIHLDVRPYQSYFILEGDLPRADVTACVPTALRLITAKQDGELTTFEMPTGATTYAAWRGHYIVLGNKQQVSDALATPTAETKAKWRTVTAAQPTNAAAWMVFEDALIANMFGVETVRYVFVMDSLETGKFGGHLVVTYRNATDAATAAGRIQRAEVQPGFQFPEAMLASLKRMTVGQTGATVEVSFTLETFGGISIEELQQFAAQLTNK